VKTLFTKREILIITDQLKKRTDMSWADMGKLFGLTRNAIRSRYYRRPANLDEELTNIPSYLMEYINTVMEENWDLVKVPSNGNDPSLSRRMYEMQKATIGDRQRRTYPRVLLRAAVYDIETMDFDVAGYTNFLICCSILPLDDDGITTISIDYNDRLNDKRVLMDVVRELEKYDILIGHNIARYDFNWLQTRLLYHDLPMPRKRWLYWDTYVSAVRIALKTRKSLANLADFFRVGGEKTSIYPTSWKEVAHPDEEIFEDAIANIIDHCEKDVILNRNVFDAMFYKDRKAINMPFVKKW
jgi:hypothetical protein